MFSLIVISFSTAYRVFFPYVQVFDYHLVWLQFFLLFNLSSPYKNSFNIEQLVYPFFSLNTCKYIFLFKSLINTLALTECL